MSEHIVIAEDDEDLAFVLREALRRQRYEPEVVPTAGALLDKLKATPYDLILLDVRLPDSDDLGLLRRVGELCRRERPQHQRHDGRAGGGGGLQFREQHGSEHSS